MRDPQLAGRTWEALGREAADERPVRGRPGVHHQRRPALPRNLLLRRICHITTYEPGRCMCCQENTELREILEE